MGWTKGGMAPLLLGAAALAGCSSLAPRYQAPALPVAAAYPADAPAGMGAAASAVSWEQFFPDPELRELLRRALAHNRDLRAAALRVEQARAIYGLRGADLAPTIGVGADLLRGQLPSAPTISSDSLNLTRSQAALSLSSWELDLWGRLRSLRAEARESFLAAGENRRAFEVGLVAQVAETYLALRELDERIALAKQTVASRRESFRIFSRRVEVGSTSRFDLTQVESLLRQAEGLTGQLEQARAGQAHALTLLVGETVEIRPEAGTGRRALESPEIAAGLPSALLTGRPDIRAAEHQLRAANANIGAARAAFFPRIALTAAGGTSSVELQSLLATPTLFGTGSGTWTFAPSISVPIFDSGRNRRALRLSELRRDEAVARYEKAIQAAFRDVANALSDEAWLTRQVAVQEAALATRRERSRLAGLRYQSGASSFLEVLDAQRELLSSEQELVRLRRERVASRVRLYAALGGGA